MWNLPKNAESPQQETLPDQSKQLRIVTSAWKQSVHRALFGFSWSAITATTLGTAFWFLSLLESTPQSTALIRQQSHVLGAAIGQRQPQLAFAALPEIVTELQAAIRAKDARPVLIDRYLDRYQSPMSGMGEYIMNTANELGQTHNIDPTYLAYLTVAIAQNESNLGKKMPPDCNNAWGYGIHSAGTLCFDSWEEGITTFMSGLAEDFIAGRGLETPEEIMTRYTPHSPNGAWAKGVNQFLEDLYEGNL